MPTSITQNNNDVTIGEITPSISITDNNKGTVTEITPPSVTSVTISQVGVQGPAGSTLAIPSTNISQPFIPITVAGTISSSGNISTQGNITGVEFTGTSFDGIFNGALSSSAQIASDISGSFFAPSSSFSSRLEAVEAGSTDKTLISSSLQFTSTDDVQFRNITSSNNISASNFIYANLLDVNTAATFGSAKVEGHLSVNGNIFSDNDSIKVINPITASKSISASGDVTADAFYAKSLGTFNGYYIADMQVVSVDDNDFQFGNNIVDTDINGKTINIFGNITASGDISSSGYMSASNLSGTNTGDQDLSTYALISQISGSLGPNGTLIRSLTATSISESFVAPSSSFSTRVTTLEGNVGQSVNTDSDVTFNTISATSLTVTSITSSIVTSSILQTEGSNIFGDAVSDTHTFNGNITASANISASGTVQAGNIELPPGGAIRPTVNNNTISFRAASHGSGEFMEIGSDIFKVYMNGGLTYHMSPTGLVLNANAADQDVRINYNDSDPAFLTDAVSHFTRMSGPVVITRSGSTVRTPLGSGFSAVTDPNSALQLSGSLYTDGQITASGNISASGDVYASNLILSSSGVIAPSVNNQTIKFMTKPPGTADNGEIFTLSQDLIEFKGATGTATPYSLLKLDLTNGAESILFNEESKDVDFKIKSNSTIAFNLKADADMMAFRNHVGIASSSNKWPTDDYTLTGAPTYQLMVMGKTKLTGSVDIEGPITASGDISASGTITANQINLDDGAKIYFNEASATDQYIQGEDSNILIESDNYLNVNSDIAVNLNTPLVLVEGIISGSSLFVTSHITASGDISASGQLHGNDLFLDAGSFDIRTGNAYTFNPSSGTGNIEFDVGVDDVKIKTNKRLEIRNDQGRLELGSVTSPTNVTASGDISASGDVAGNTITVAGSDFINLHSTGYRVNSGAGPLNLFGNVTASGNISSSGYVAANAFRGNGRIYPGYDVSTDHFLGKTTTTNPILRAVGGFNVDGHVTASGNISASGTIYAHQYFIQQRSLLDYEPSAEMLRLGYNNDTKTIIVGRNGVTTNGILLDANVTASSDISSSGDVYGANFFADNTYRIKDSGGTSRHYITRYGNNISLGNTNFAGTNLTGSLSTNSHITASGDISGSQLGTFTSGTGSFDVLSGDTSLNAGLEVTGFISATDVTASGYIQGNILYDTGSISATGNVQGDVVRFGNVTTLTGAIYARTGSGWTLAHSGSSGCASSSLGLAVGTNSTTNGMLLRGMANIGYDPGGDNGCALYLEAPGSASSNVTATDGHVARVVGWNYGSDTVYFNPDNTWVVK